MKILFLNHNQEGLGTYWRCFFFAKYLSRRGCQIIMICASGKKFDFLVRRKKINKNFTIITLPRLCYHKYFTGQIIFRLPLNCIFVLFLDYDLIYAFTVAQPQIAIPAILGKFLKRKRLIIDWDDLWSGGFAKIHGGLIEFVLTFFERKSLRFADRITYVSELIGNEIKRIGFLNRAQKIPNGANVSQINPVDKNEAKRKLNLDEKEKYIVSVGNTYTESLKLLVDAFSRVSRKVKNLTLILVGSIEMPQTFSFRKKKVMIVGKKPYSEIPYWLAVADVLVLPMEDNLIEKARFPIRFGDYLCAKRPIVSNAVGEVKYFLEKYQAGLTCEPHSVEDFSNKILLALNNDALSNKISENARKLAEGDLNWEKIAVKLTEVLK